jgi:hypothetical protein
MTVDDPYLPLAFSLSSSPGAYAVLAGAGVSKGAGLPSAWDIEVDLVRRIAQRDNADVAIGDSNAEAWYFDHYGKQLTYSSVIEDVAPQPHERQALLEKYFESTSDDDQAGVPIPPSAAHRAVARMMGAGTIRVIVTMNFDRLFEQALNELGIQPTIVATESDAEGVGPLRLVQACVIHVHGDYRNATSMLNTAAELKGYGPEMKRLLREVLGDYGLIVAGWSVQHDTALREAAMACCTKRFTMGWIAPGQLTEAARELVDSKSAVVFETTADDALGHLADQVFAIREKRARHPLTVAVAASRIKRDLTRQSPAIAAHDMVAEEFTRLGELPEFTLDDYNNQDPDHALRLCDRVLEGTRIAAAAVAVLAFWGPPEADSWWIPQLERLTRVPRRDGISWLINLQLVAAATLFYAAGTATVSAQNYARVSRILSLHGESNEHAGAIPLADMLAPNPSKMRLTTAQHYLSVAPILIEALGLGSDVIEDGWQLFEILRLATKLLSNERFDWAVENYASADKRRDATAGIDQTANLQAAATKNEILDDLAAYCHPDGLHLFAVEKVYSPGTNFRWGSPIAERLAADISRERTLHPLVERLEVAPARMALALSAVSRAIGRVADKHPATQPPPGGGVMRQEVWLDA